MFFNKFFRLRRAAAAVLAGICLMTGLLPAAAAAELPALQGSAACLMDADSGQVLYEKYMDGQRQPASITKIMTVLLAAEKMEESGGSLSDMVTMGHDAVFSVPRSTSHISLSEGEQLPLEQMMLAAMLPSANDAANGLAEYVAGSMDAFPALMNSRAAECGALNTHFANAHGLDQEGHLTTAYDMACITREALKNEVFCQIFGTTEYTIPPTNKQEEARNIGAGHKMVFSFTKYYDESVIGGKSGYTTQAGHTLVTVARREGRTLIAVVLGCPSNSAMYKDTIALFDYGFGNFTPLTIPAATLTAGSDLVDTAEDMTLWVTEGVTADSLKLDYATASADGDSAAVTVTVSLGTATGLQYATLGSQTLYYEQETVPVITEPVVEEEKELPALLRIPLILGQVAMVTLCVLIMLGVYFLFGVRAYYDLRRYLKKRRIKRTR